MAKFQRRHYEAVADAIRSSKPDERAAEGPLHYDVLLTQWGVTIDTMTGMFLMDNPNFRVSTFHERCGDYK